MSDIVVHSRQVEMIPLEALKGYEKNARTHPENQIASLVNIIRDSGFTNPVLIDDDDVIVAGHGRAEAARKLKMAEVPCVRLSGLTPEQIKAIRLSDNATGLQSGWDETLLRLEITDLKGSGFDLSLTGFTSVDLTKLFATYDGPADPDDEPDEVANPVCQAGDLWRCGDHWVMCGDSTSPADVERLLGGAKPSLLISDQPYGTNLRSATKRGGEYLRDGAKRAKGEVRNDTRADWREAWALAPCDVAYIWHNPLEAAVVQAGLESCGFDLRAQIIWAKNSHVITGPNGHFHWKHEAAFYAVRKGRPSHWNGSRKENTLWEYPRPKKSETGHATQKPVELFKRPIELNSEPGARIFDPFIGAGAALVAAQMTKRVCYGMEIAPEHVDRSLVRYAAFTGSAPVLAETGETFEQVKARRLEVV